MYICNNHINNNNINDIHSVEFRDRPEPDAETSRTEPHRTMTCSKSEGRSASNRNRQSPNRTESNANYVRKLQKRNESNRTGSFLIWLSLAQSDVCCFNMLYFQIYEIERGYLKLKGKM